MIYTTLLITHIISGFIALVSALFTILSKALNWSHKIHQVSGKTYCLCMLLIFITACTMSILKPNLFLLLIALFSFNFVLSGWRFAKNKTGVAHTFDWLRIALVSIIALCMIGIGATSLQTNNNAVILIIFGLLCLFFCFADYRVYKQGLATGKQRIVRHLSSMLGGTISTVTAVVVVNFQTEPAFIGWLLPSAILVPVIIFWSIKLKR